MDSRLQRVGDSRLFHLHYSDAPRVAQAIVDAIAGDARVLVGSSHDVRFVKFVRDKVYTVVVREDDWGKIFPFLRYSTASYNPVIPPNNQPSSIPSPQPNNVMQPPPVNPDGGLRSFLEGLSFDEYSKIQRLLTIMSVDNIDRQLLPVKPLHCFSDAPSLVPPEQRTDTSSFYNRDLYNKMVVILQKLFPTDFPTAF